MGLKKDKSKYTIIIYTNSKENEPSVGRFYDKGDDIDCYNRLYLTSENLDLLSKVANAHNRWYKLSIKPSADKDILDKYAKVICSYWEKFDDSFVNPYELDMEYHEDCKSFFFWDYEYEYILRKTRYKNGANKFVSGWEILCQYFYDRGKVDGFKYYGELMDTE